MPASITAQTTTRLWKSKAISDASTILITGAGRRLGAALAKGLAAAGHPVIIHYHASVDAAASVKREIEAAGGTCETIRADLADRHDVAELIPACIARCGPIGVLINNASGYHYDNARTLEPETWQANLRTNLEAPVFLATAFEEHSDTPDRCVINMLDFKVLNLNPDYFSYTAAKVAMAGVTTMLAMSWKGRVRVNAVAPGLTLRSGRQTEEQFQRAFCMTPAGHGPTVEEIVTACRLLIATQSINGQIICLDGGASLRPRARDISVDPAALTQEP